ncbi:MAG: phosphomannomutase, partial [Candidatus Moranbacteria bacterium]|nr:phosphomannomutase [Candidatus Moranbacteria bacterium]
NFPSIMITGSHIPFDMNGIKFNMPFGEVLKSDEPRIIELKKQLTSDQKLAKKFKLDGSSKKKNILPEITTEAQQLYIQRYTNFLPKNCLDRKKIVFYGHSSVGRELLPKIFETLGAKVIKVNYTDDFIPIDTEAIREEDLILAKEWIDKYHPDVVFSTDGDSDRPMLFDEKGQFIRGDLLCIFSAIYLKANSVSVPVSANTALEKLNKFKNITRTRIGSPYVIEGMSNALKTGIKRVISYEANGGFLTADKIEVDEKILLPLPTRDAVFPLIGILMLAKNQNLTLSELITTLPQRIVYSSSIKGIPTENSQSFLKKLSKMSDFSKLTNFFQLPAQIEKIDFTDGARMYLSNEDIVHLRPSGNSPELRCYSESKTEIRAKKLTDTTLKLAKEKI